MYSEPSIYFDYLHLPNTLGGSNWTRLLVDPYVNDPSTKITFEQIFGHGSPVYSKRANYTVLQ